VAAGGIHAGGYVILLMPQTAHAAAEIGNGTAYVAPGGIVNGVSFAISHANNF
jgi:hypothetical protein